MKKYTILYSNQSELGKSTVYVCKEHELCPNFVQIIQFPNGSDDQFATNGCNHTKEPAKWGLSPDTVEEIRLANESGLNTPQKYSLTEFRNL